jgi:hypothetical protein
MVVKVFKKKEWQRGNHQIDHHCTLLARCGFDISLATHWIELRSIKLVNFFISFCPLPFRRWSSSGIPGAGMRPRRRARALMEPGPAERHSHGEGRGRGLQRCGCRRLAQWPWQAGKRAIRRRQGAGAGPAWGSRCSSGGGRARCSGGAGVQPTGRRQRWAATSEQLSKRPAARVQSSSSSAQRGWAGHHSPSRNVLDGFGSIKERSRWCCSAQGWEEHMEIMLLPAWRFSWSGEAHRDRVTYSMVPKGSKHR